MNLILFGILFLLLISVRPCLREYNGDYIAKDGIQPIKGLFILLVFASHFLAYVRRDPASDQIYLMVRDVLGQMIVVPFLFYSGFGVSESIRKKGLLYLEEFPARRIFRVMVEFMLIVLLYAALSFWTGVAVNAKNLALALLGWTSLGNSNWYIFVIVLLYALTWLSYVVFADGQDRSALGPCILLTALALLLVIVLSRCRPFYVYNTVFAYVAGCWYSFYRDQIERTLSRGLPYVTALAVSAIVFGLFYADIRFAPTYQVAAIAFAALVLLVTMRCRLESPLLSFCGTHLFSIYMMQRLPMLLLKKFSFCSNKYVYFLLCLSITLVAGWMFDQLMHWFWAHIPCMCRALGLMRKRNNGGSFSERNIYTK